jgi:hypothetical protein
MPTPPKLLIAATLLFSQTLYAASVEDYIVACNTNQNNKIDPALCECMGNKSKELTEEEFEFFYAISTKDQEKANKGHATLETKQKVKVMQLTMMAPAYCTNELAAQKNTSDSKDSSEKMTGASSSSVSEATDSASQ